MNQRVDLGKLPHERSLFFNDGVRTGPRFARDNAIQGATIGIKAYSRSIRGHLFLQSGKCRSSP
jgi:hypothetical protein